MKHSLRVLIVDDDMKMIRLFRVLLKQMNIDHVKEAADGLQALEALAVRRFDVVISDWHMRELNGLDLLRHVRRDPALAQLPFIMVTAEHAPERIAEAEAAGVSSYILKPFEAQTLMESVRAVCLHG